MNSKVALLPTVNHFMDEIPIEAQRLTKTYARLQRGRVVIGDVLYAKGGSFGPRRQTDYQLVVIHTGFLTLTLDNQVIEIPEGHGILLRPGHREHFHFAPHRETRHSWVAVEPSLLSFELQQQFELHGGPLPFLGRMATLLDIARHDAVSASAADSLHNAACEALGISILCTFASAVRDRRKASHPGETVLWRMDRFLAESSACPLQLNDIARAAGVSRQHLLKLCRLANRPTPMEQLYATRLDLASDLLLHTGFSIAEIANCTGFVNQFHLSRRFKQRTGKSPSVWRGQVWN
ncbi:helix-turn-helix transcriptional regulator [Terracidiphilus gabretensis]|uniref:helix-turn-helix transcriptional regulator n=1 Tax=Terracidiphilus gabretensis TaxID=1577687 RepID=UPI00071B9CCD|nr:AraC family transcriptional regulator [Terracidiphilus gabretensis]